MRKKFYCQKDLLDLFIFKGWRKQVEKKKFNKARCLRFIVLNKDSNQTFPQSFELSRISDQNLELTKLVSELGVMFESLPVSPLIYHYIRIMKSQSKSITLKE